MHGMAPPTSSVSQNGTPGLIQPLDTHGGIANMRVDMSDAPPVLSGKQLAHLDLGIREIDVTDAKGKTHVVAQYGSPFIIDVLRYQGATGGNVGQTSVTEQTYRGIRFVIDVAASQAIYTDNSSAPLNFLLGKDTQSDSGAGRTTDTTGAGPGLVAITDNRQFTIGTNVTELVNADFNAFESLAPANGGRKDNRVGAFDTSGGIALCVRPTLFVAAGWSAGQLGGTVTNGTGEPVSGATVVAIGPGGVVGNTVSTDSSGNFYLHNLPAGTYRLQIYNNYTNAAGADFSSEGATSDRDTIQGPTVTVTPGLTTSLGTITD